MPKPKPTPTPTELEVRGTLHPAVDEWILHFNWETNPVPMNGSRGNPLAHARKVKQIRSTAHTRAAYARIPVLGRCRAQLTWWVTVNRVRDPDNLAQLEKPLFDALVLAGVVDDDRPELMEKPRALIRPVADSNGLVSTAGFTLHITRIEQP